MNKPSTITAHYDCNDLLAEAVCGQLLIRVNHYGENRFALHYFWRKDETEIGWTEADATYFGDGTYQLNPVAGDWEGYQPGDEINQDEWDKAMFELGNAAMEKMFIIDTADAGCGGMDWYSTWEAAEKEIRRLEAKDEAEGDYSCGFYGIQHGEEWEKIY